MSLIELINNQTTDKNSTHYYLETYERIFKNKKNNNINILEIGIQDGGSIKLWKDYFTYGKIYGIDICDINKVKENLILMDDKVKLFFNTDAYNKNFIENNFTDIKFDYIIDDGPHTLESMILFIELYLPLLKDDGILIIEDIQSFNWLDILKEKVPEKLKDNIKIIDVRHVKGRYDDLMFIVDKAQIL